MLRVTVASAEFVAPDYRFVFPCRARPRRNTVDMARRKGHDYSEECRACISLLEEAGAEQLPRAVVGACVPFASVCASRQASGSRGGFLCWMLK